MGHVRCKRMEGRRQAPSSLNAPYWCEAGTLQGPIVNMQGFSRLSMHIPVVSSLLHFSISESVLKFLWCLRYEHLIEFIWIFDAYLCVVKSDGLSVAESICIKAHQIVFMNLGLEIMAHRPLLVSRSCAALHG